MATPFFMIEDISEHKIHQLTKKSCDLCHKIDIFMQNIPELLLRHFM